MKYVICFFMFISPLLSADETSKPCDCAEEPVNVPRTSANQVAAYKCRIKIRTLSKDLRNFVETTVAKTIPGFWRKIQTFREFYPYIDMLERNAISCCQNIQTSKTCTEPLVRQLELWNSEGLPIIKE